MARRRLLWQLYLTYLLVIVVALGTATLYTSKAVRKFYWEETFRDLEARAGLAEGELASVMGDSPAVIDALCKRLGAESATRITVISLDGVVLGDSHEPPEAMDNHRTRPEIRDAIDTGQGRSIRFSRTLQTELVYVAKRAASEGAPAVVVRVAVPETPLETALYGLARHMTVAGLGAAALAALLSLVVSRWITHPLEGLRAGAERLAHGDLSQRVEIAGSVEIAGVGEALNAMAEQLDDRITTILKQHNEQEAVLSSMVEGVIAVDNEQQLISMNQAAAILLEVDGRDLQRRSLPAVVRNSGLQRFVVRTLASPTTIEDEFVSLKQDRRVLQARGTVLVDGDGDRIGAVIVINDVTRLRRLEEVRRDFVANVSHELKTPITSIKGFVETLMDGALDDRETATRFLEIVAKQSDRLNAIIEDLLTLSRLEQEQETPEGMFQVAPLRAVLEEAVLLCRRLAGERGMGIELECAPEVAARINGPLLGQGVTNLIDNAIKYGKENSTVSVSAVEAGDDVRISVCDSGRGIPAEHLPRIFERFYRVDKDRSREQGGTGLGLSIVRHIAQTHHGRVTVQSDVGKGSTFTIHLPATHIAADLAKS